MQTNFWLHAHDRSPQERAPHKTSISFAFCIIIYKMTWAFQHSSGPFKAVAWVVLTLTTSHLKCVEKLVCSARPIPSSTSRSAPPAAAASSELTRRKSMHGLPCPFPTTHSRDGPATPSSEGPTDAKSPPFFRAFVPASSALSSVSSCCNETPENIPSPDPSGVSTFSSHSFWGPF
jgi:hypothetical protein